MFKAALELNEQQLVTALQVGDEAAFARLVEAHEQMVYNTALGMLQSAHDAEDIAQEVFVQAYESMRSFKGEAKLSTWLYRITISKCLDKLKYKNRKKRGGVVLSLFNKKGTMHDVPDFEHPGVQLANKERAVILFKAIAMLPDKQRVAFILSKVEVLSQNEIAEVMQCTVAAVEGHMHRAKENLRKMLSDYYYET